MKKVHQFEGDVLEAAMLAQSIANDTCESAYRRQANASNPLTRFLADRALERSELLLDEAFRNLYAAEDAARFSVRQPSLRLLHGFPSSESQPPGPFRDGPDVPPAA